MQRHFSDPDVRLLATVSAAIEPDYKSAQSMWAGSPFAWIVTIRSSRQRGKIGEQLVSGWCAAKGLDVTGSGSSDFDRVIHGHRAEIKFSTLWSVGHYVFQQFRDQDYDIAIFLGLSPFDAECWVVPKDVLMRHVIGHTGQHGGRTARDTAWLHVRPSKTPDWLMPHGGKLRDAYQALTDLGRGPHR